MIKRAIVIPHEHGGWAMVSVPFLIGMIAGSPRWMHVLLFLAWLLLYLSSYPFLQAVKRKTDKGYWIRWGSIYSAIALICLILPLIEEPSLFYMGIPFLILLLVNVWHVKQKSERALVNDLCAILNFSLGGGAAYVFGEGVWRWETTVVVALPFLYFAGTAVFVKSIFREKNNKRWVVYVWVYHLLLLLVPWVIGYADLTVVLLFPLGRTIVFAGRTLRPMKVGIIEIIGSVLFGLLTTLLMN